MAYRLACDHADLIAGIANLVGSSWLDSSQCNPSDPVHILHLHGTKDELVRYKGGCFLEDQYCYPGAEESVLQWIDFNNCNLVPDPFTPPVNLDNRVPGNETQQYSVSSGCDGNGTISFWQLRGVSHGLRPSSIFSQLVLEDLLANPKQP